MGEVLVRQLLVACGVRQSRPTCCSHHDARNFDGDRCAGDDDLHLIHSIRFDSSCEPLESLDGIAPHLTTMMSGAQEEI